MIRAWAVIPENAKPAVFTMLVDAERSLKGWAELGIETRIVELVEREALTNVKSILGDANKRLIQLEAMVEKLIEQYEGITNGK